MESSNDSSKVTPLVNGQVDGLREPLFERPSSPAPKGVSGANEYRSVTPDYADYPSSPKEFSQFQKEYPQSQKEFHTAQQEYQSVPEYQTVQAEYQTVQPEYHPPPQQQAQPPRSPAYGSPTHRGVPLRRTDSRTFLPVPPQQRPNSPLNFQPQNFPQRPPPNNYRPNINQPINQPQQYRPQLQPPPQNQDYQRVYTNQPEKRPLNLNQPTREPQSPQSQPQSPQNPQPPPIPRPNNPQGIVRRPNPWALLKQKLPADVRQQFVPIRRPQFEGRMQTPEQGGIQRPPSDGQPMNMGMVRGGSPNQGMQGPNQGMQSPSPNQMYNGRPPSGNPPPKMGMPMQRPMSQEGRESPSPHPGQGMQRVISGERRTPFDLQRTDSVRVMDPRGLTPPQQGVFSPPPRPMGDRGRETPPGLPRSPKSQGDDDDDVVYSPGSDPRMNMGRGQPPPMRPPSAPRPGSIPPDLNRDMNSPRPLQRTESRQSFEMRGPSPMDNRGDPKLMTGGSPLSRPMSSDLAKTPFQYRPESQHQHPTPPLSPKPDFQSPRPPSISPQDSLDRQRTESRGPTPQNITATPRPSPDFRPSSRASEESKHDSGKLTPASGGESRNSSPQPTIDSSRKLDSPIRGPERPPSVVGGSVSPALKSSEPSRTSTPSDSLNPKTAEASHNNSPTPIKVGNDSGTGTPLPGKDSLVSGGNSRENTPIKTPDRSATPDGKKEIERPTSLNRSPSSKQDLFNDDTENEARKSPLVRTPSRTSSAGKGNDAKSPLQRVPSGKRPKTPKTPDGDHDSGVDESTQRKDGPTTNGDLGSPSKSSSKIPAPKRLSMPSPTKSTKASPKTPEAPSTAEKKKVPMNKIQVGAAPSPNLKVIKSKIGSLQNTTHKPGGGNIKIENRKLDWKAQPRIEAKNDTYQPGGGDKKITQVKLQWNAKPKVGSLDNATHKPGGGEKKIESVKLDFKDKAKPKVGSKDNIKHTPGGGNVKTSSQNGSQDGNPGDIEDQKLEIKVQSKIGSLDNVKHRPGGGDKKIFDDKDYLKQMSGPTSKAGSEGVPSGTQGENGWSSASTSRRTSRDRKHSSDRRYRSESRLGLRTPEPLRSPKDEHCSLREKHNLKQQEILQEAECLAKDALAEEEATKEQKELVSPLRPTSSASEQTMTRDSSEDKDLNSNQTNSYSDTCDVKRDSESSVQNINVTNQTSVGKQNVVGKVDPKQLPESTEVNNKNQEESNAKDISGPKQEIAKENQMEIPDTGKTAVTETTIEDNIESPRKEVEVTSKAESKEDKVKEVKEVDSKEMVNNQSNSTDVLDKVNLPNTSDVIMAPVPAVKTDDKVNSTNTSDVKMTPVPGVKSDDKVDFKNTPDVNMTPIKAVKSDDKVNLPNTVDVNLTQEQVVKSDDKVNLPNTVDVNLTQVQAFKSDDKVNLPNTVDVNLTQVQAVKSDDKVNLPNTVDVNLTQVHAVKSDDKVNLPNTVDVNLTQVQVVKSDDKVNLPNTVDVNLTQVQAFKSDDKVNLPNTVDVNLTQVQAVKSDDKVNLPNTVDVNMKPVTAVKPDDKVNQPNTFDVNMTNILEVSSNNDTSNTPKLNGEQSSNH